MERKKDIIRKGGATILIIMLAMSGSESAGNGYTAGAENSGSATAMPEINTLPPGEDRSSCTVYRGYITGNMEMWRQGMAELRQQLSSDRGGSTLYTLAEARYGYIGYLIGRDDKNAARPQVEIFEEEIEKLAGYPGYEAETEAFRLALLGFRMGLNPARAMTLGPKALRQLETAMKAGDRSPVVWIEKANSEAHMPAFAGGSKEKAAASFREAIRLFEADQGLSECNWRYLNSMVLLGQLLERMDDYRGAAEAYRMALRRAPDFQWVRNELLPGVEKKIK